MGMKNRPAACAATGKRLRAKSWYYRNGKHYFNKRAWEEEQAKKAREGDTAKAQEAVVAEEPTKAKSAKAQPAPEAKGSESST